MSRVSHLISVAKSLPPSPIRAAGTPQLSDALEKIITRTFPSDRSADPATTMGPGEERAVEKMISSIERIKSNEALRAYPLSSLTLKPAHDPLYYKRMLDGVARSRRGEGRSWWRRFFQLRGEA